MHSEGVVSYWQVIDHTHTHTHTHIYIYIYIYIYKTVWFWVGWWKGINWEENKAKNVEMHFLLKDRCICSISGYPLLENVAKCQNSMINCFWGLFWVELKLWQCRFGEEVKRVEKTIWQAWCRLKIENSRENIFQHPRKRNKFFFFFTYAFFADGGKKDMFF